MTQKINEDLSKIHSSFDTPYKRHVRSARAQTTRHNDYLYERGRSGLQTRGISVYNPLCPVASCKPIYYVSITSWDKTTSGST